MLTLFTVSFLMSQAAVSCEGITTSCDLSKLDIETQGSTEFRNPQAL